MLTSTIPRTTWDVKFRILGVDSRVHPSFWLGSILFSWGELDALWLVAIVALMFVSIVVHELGHALMGRRFGDRRPSIVLYALGGFYETGTGSRRHKRAIIVSLAGPGAGFILGAVVLGIFLTARAGVFHVSDFVEGILQNAMIINFGWGLINLLPVYPLDGGRILQEWLSWKRPNLPPAQTFTISMYVALAVVVIALGLHFVPLPYLGRGEWFVAVLFGVLAFQNYRFRKVALMDPYQHQDAPREPWEQDPDWWKKND